MGVREHAVEVGGVHVLADGRVHGELAEDGARGEGHVGDERAVERLVREGELLERRDGDARDDGEEGGVDLPLEDGAQHEVRHHAGEHRLRRLDRLRERDGARTESDHRAGMADGVRGADGRESLPALGLDLGLLADAGGPERQDPRHADEERAQGHHPRHGECVLDALVRNVVHDVQEEPAEDEREELGLLHHGHGESDLARIPAREGALLNRLVLNAGGLPNRCRCSRSLLHAHEGRELRRLGERRAEGHR